MSKKYLLLKMAVAIVSFVVLVLLTLMEQWLSHHGPSWLMIGFGKEHCLSPLVVILFLIPQLASGFLILFVWTSDFHDLVSK